MKFFTIFTTIIITILWFIIAVSIFIIPAPQKEPLLGDEIPSVFKTNKKFNDISTHTIKVNNDKCKAIQK